MSVSMQPGPLVPFNQIQSTCPPVSTASFNSCVAIMSELDSKSSRAITDLFGGILGFCKLPELPFEACRMKNPSFLNFLSTDICAPVMRGVDHFKRPYVTFGVQQVVAEPTTHQPIDTYGEPCVFTVFQRYSDNPNVWMSSGNPASDMLPLNTLEQQYVDSTGRRRGSLEKLQQLLEKGFLTENYEWHELTGEIYNIELQLQKTFNQALPMCPKKDEL